MDRRSKSLKALLVSLMILLYPYAGCANDLYKPLPGVLHIHSRFSSGDHSLGKLVRMASQRQLKYLV
ncbi:MAG: hypothetical protein JSU72_20385, partial [Deltaproteobacteria bacterium]